MRPVAYHRPLAQLSAQAHAGVAGVKPRRGGRNQKMGKIFEKYGM